MFEIKKSNHRGEKGIILVLLLVVVVFLWVFLGRGGGGGSHFVPVIEKKKNSHRG